LEFVLPSPRCSGNSEIVGSLRFAVVDGAQALGHIPVSDVIDSCDVFIAGCHKWLQAHLPLGIALTGNGLTTEQFASLAMNSDTSSDCHDPLLRFSQELRTERLQKYSETVNVLPLLTANSTLRAASKALNTITDSLTVRQTNRQNVADLLHDSPWCPVASTSMDCGILVVEPRQADRWNPEAITAAMHQRGISLSVYPDRKLRLSMPSQILTESELQFLRDSFTAVSQQMM
jgi:selenocysteine lyase/cysteine desulfurase